MPFVLFLVVPRIDVVVVLLIMILRPLLVTYRPPSRTPRKEETAFSMGVIVDRSTRRIPSMRVLAVWGATTTTNEKDERVYRMHRIIPTPRCYSIITNTNKYVGNGSIRILVPILIPIPIRIIMVMIMRMAIRRNDRKKHRTIIRTGK